MLRNLFQALFGSFIREQKRFSEEESAMIKRMVEEANAIADGSYIPDSKLPPPVIPERRKQPR